MDMHENAESQNGEVIVNWHPYKVALRVKKMGYFTKKGYLTVYRHVLPNFDEEMEKAGGFSNMNRIYLRGAPRITAIGEDHIQILCQGDDGFKILNVALANPESFCVGDEIQSMILQYIGIFGEGQLRHHTFRRVVTYDN